MERNATEGRNIPVMGVQQETSSLYTRPHSLSLQFRCSRHHRERLLRWAGVKGTPYRASCKQTTTVQSSGHGKTRYHSSSRLCRVYSDLSRCLPPVSSGLLKMSPKSLNDAVSNSELCSHTCHTAAFLQLPNDSTSGKSIQMSSNRLIIRHFSLRQQFGVILTAIRRSISLPEILILHQQHALYYSDSPPLRLPAYLPTRGLLATDHVILNHGQVTWTTPELAPPLLTTTPHQREDVSALDRFNVHRCPTRRVFSGTGFEPVTKQATVRYLYHSATAATCV
ncbi:uncharacterized protein TNCV_1324381 [Trichonephila clavipes]|nr:uncharacterized protein TNCV_1324381 [Trichonephila clavipes]